MQYKKQISDRIKKRYSDNKIETKNDKNIKFCNCTYK